MATSLAAIFQDINSVLVICPCCGDVLWLSEARPHLKGRKSSTVFDRLDEDLRRVERAEERLEQQSEKLRERARATGQRKAKAQLKKVDPIFSGRGLDPQDVKVIFDPVQYIVFDGLNDDCLRSILFMTDEPTTVTQEKVHDSIERAIRRGNMEFFTMRVADDATIRQEGRKRQATIDGA